MSDSSESNLGFTFRLRKNGEVHVLRGEALVVTLRGASAQEFLAEVGQSSPSEAQQVMARITGNYKRGNERLASNHNRNRR